MQDISLIEREDFLQHYRKLYTFFREVWSMDKTSRLKEILYRSFVKSQGEDGSVAIYDLLSQMRTAVIIIDEIGLKQSTVSAVLLFHPFKTYITVRDRALFWCRCRGYSARVEES